MKFYLEIDCDNDDFQAQDPAESHAVLCATVARMLLVAATHIEESDDRYKIPIFDANGNRVGIIHWDE